MDSPMLPIVDIEQLFVQRTEILFNQTSLGIDILIFHQQMLFFIAMVWEAVAQKGVL